MRILKSPQARLLILTLAHFSVDFCGGLTIPLPEPTMVRHLGVGLPQVALLFGGFALIVNLVQPLAGWLLPRRGVPVLLAFGPAAAACVAFIGLTHSVWGISLMLATAALGVGVLHPEGALAAHRVAGGRKGLGMSVFMAGGYFGFATGSLVAGTWVEYRDQGLAHFWWLALPALLVTALVLLSGLHRVEGHGSARESTDGVLPFWPVWALAICVAANMCLLVRFLPILLVRRFPLAAAQGWSGAAVFATGITGALGAFFWGHVTEHRSRGKAIALTQVLCIPFLYGLLNVRTPSVAPLWALGVGATMGGVFPLTVVLAREAHGCPERLRMGLSIGGAWGLGEVAFIIGGRYVGYFPAGAPEPVAAVLGGCWVLLGLTAVLALLVGALERSGSKVG